MKYAGSVVALAVLFVWCASPLSAQSDEQRVHYEPTWESLDKHQTPKWLMDAKLGIFIYPPPATKAEWEAHHKLHGHKPNVTPHIGDNYPAHCAAEAWDRIPWDPEGLAQLAVDAGARYVVFGRSSFIINQPSKYADVEGSAFMRMGPKDRDYVGDMAKAVRARGLRYGLYTNYINPTQHPQWVETVKEAIDMYQPATLWFDGDKLSYPAKELKSRELLAYYYNHSEKQDEVAAEDAMGSYKRATWGKELSHGDWFRKEMGPRHSDIPKGYFVRYETLYRWRHRSPVNESAGMVNNLVEWLADAVSKNGNLELAIHLEPELYKFEKRTLIQVGAWLEVNGEAIYETRPWREATAEDTTASGIHVRYTVKGDSLYAILFKWPGGPGSVARGVGRSVFTHLKAHDDSEVQMLGADGDLPWQQTEEGLEVFTPTASGGSGFETEIPCDHAYVYKITPRPTWVE